MSPTFRQLIAKPRIARRFKNKRPALGGCPQKRATCWRVFSTTPRKPNSALRKVARVIITSSRKRVTTFIPGMGHNLQKHSVVLLRGGRVRDLPGMKYRLIRGKYDLKGLHMRRNGRSKFGAKKPEGKNIGTKVRK